VGTFCQICRHPTDQPPGHEPGCPVLTGEPVRGSTHWSEFGSGINQQDMQPLNQIQQAQGGMMAAGAAYEPEHPFPGSAADERNQTLLAEIERLRTKAEKDKNTLLVALEAAANEIAQLKAALEDIDDHGRALHFIEALRAAKEEIARLKALLARAAAALDNGDLAVLEEMREAGEGANEL
jgi:hypothetical protein